MPYYDFIEIGTSDFDTLLQTCDDTAVGLSIDGLKYYLDCLPTKANVQKVHAAISDTDGEMDMYFIETEIIEKSDFQPWLRGCNSLGKPHAGVLAYLKESMISEDLIKKMPVSVLSVHTLFQRYTVESLGILKVDTEGHDCIILNAYIDYCTQYPAAFAKKIQFETNDLTRKEDQQAVIARLLNFGYTIESEGGDTVLTRPA